MTQGAPGADLISPQWFKDGERLTDGGQFTGTATPQLRISNVQFTNTGTYTLSFTNVTAAEPESVTVSAQLEVIDYPQVTGEIISTTRGTDVTFSVRAEGGMLDYQWLWQGEPIPGATSSTLTLTNAYVTANAGYYNVRVSNPANPEGTLAPAPALFVKATPGGNYNGLFYNESEVSPESTGFIQFTVNQRKRRFSGRLTCGTAKYPFTGTFAPEHTAEVQVSRKLDSPLFLTLQLLTVNDLPRIVGHISSDSWTSPVAAERLHFSGNITTPLEGRYTMALQNTNTSPLVPNGAPAGAVVVRRNGTAVLVGRAADGSPIQQSAGLSRVGDWPLHAITHRGNGKLTGWVRIGQSANDSTMTGGVAWVKAPGLDALYPDGFNVVLQSIGSSYVPPTTNYAVNLTESVASLYGGDLYAGDVPAWAFINVKLLPPAKFRPEKSPEKLEIRLNPVSGLVSGSFFNFASQRRSPIHGVIFQQQRFGLGFFTSDAAAGAFSLSRRN
jgi:hypothetical protein